MSQVKACSRMAGVRRLIPLLFLLPILGGCAFTPVDLKMPKDLNSEQKAIGSGEEVRVHVPFEDARDSQKRCGMKKNGYNMDTADVNCTKEPELWLSHRLSDELSKAGFNSKIVRQVESKKRPRSVLVEGRLLKFFLEPKVGAFVGILEMDINLKLTIYMPGGKKAEKEFFSKGGKEVLVWTAGKYNQVLLITSKKLIDKIVSSVDEVMSKNVVSFN